MKNIIAFAALLITTSAFAINIDAGNNMGAEPSPERNASSASYDRKTYNNNKMTRPTYSSEVTNDSISTGQSATRRNSVDTPAARPVERCIDRSGYSYSKNDSGYAACVNQSSRMMRQ